MLTLSNLIKLAIFIVGLVLGVFLTNAFRNKEVQQVAVNPFKPTVTIQFDTVEVPVDHYIDRTVEVPTIRYVYKDRIIPTHQTDGTPTLAVRRYQDTSTVEPGVRLDYDAEVTGTLDKIKLGFHDTRPKEVVTRTISIDTPVPYKVSSTGVFVGGFANLNGKSFGPQVNIVTPKFNFGVNYDVRNKTNEPVMRTQVSAGYKLFGPK
jgi:hypothetical protein